METGDSNILWAAGQSSDAKLLAHTFRVRRPSIATVFELFTHCFSGIHRFS